MCMCAHVRGCEVAGSAWGLPSWLVVCSCFFLLKHLVTSRPCALVPVRPRTRAPSPPCLGLLVHAVGMACTEGGVVGAATPSLWGLSVGGRVGGGKSALGQT